MTKTYDMLRRIMKTLNAKTERCNVYIQNAHVDGVTVSVFWKEGFNLSFARTYERDDIARAGSKLVGIFIDEAIKEYKRIAETRKAAKQ